jgi:hypothetical protein
MRPLELLYFAVGIPPSRPLQIYLIFSISPVPVYERIRDDNISEEDSQKKIHLKSRYL